jgi:hypothetical protein
MPSSKPSRNRYPYLRHCERCGEAVPEHHIDGHEAQHRQDATVEYLRRTFPYLQVGPAWLGGGVGVVEIAFPDGRYIWVDEEDGPRAGLYLDPADDVGTMVSLGGGDALVDDRSTLVRLEELVRFAQGCEACAQFHADHLGEDGHREQLGADDAASAQWCVVFRGATAQIAEYLPSNFWVETQGDGWAEVCGTDQAGWTMREYVVPRLATGMMYLAEGDREAVYGNG